MKYADLSAEAIASLATEKRGAFDALIALDTPSIEQVNEAEALAVEIEEIASEIARRETAASESADKFAALKTRFTAEPVEEEAADDEIEEATEDEEEEEEAPVTKARSTKVAALATKVTRPAPPKRNGGMISITAAADVPDFATGSNLGDLAEVGKALVNRMRGFGTPSGDGKTVNLQHYGVASFRLDFPDDMIVDRHNDDMEVLTRASKETRLPGNSLTAAGGWCSPSETLYDLCAGETLEGILSVPEVNVKRGGINYTSGPSFSDFYADAASMFVQTEAQAIAATVKPCVEIDCPTFTDVRLDAVGLCIKAPILTNAAYPELVQRYISGTLIAHQHLVNANVIGRLVTAAGAARVLTGLGSTAQDTLAGLELIADQTRQKYRLSMTHTLEVVAPFWVKGAIRADLGIRSGRAKDAVTDAEITAHFSARNLSVSFVYDWQDLPLLDDAGPPILDGEAYPATYNALMYPAGTFIKGVSDVINLNAVYDAASLSTNLYTALFMEQGLLIAQMCYDADLLTLPVCNAGRTGINDLTCV